MIKNNLASNQKLTNEFVNRMMMLMLRNHHFQSLGRRCGIIMTNSCQVVLTVKIMGDMIKRIPVSIIVTDSGLKTLMPTEVTLLNGTTENEITLRV